MKDEDLNNSCLGESDEEILLENSDENRAITTRMINASRRQLDIISRDLDPAIYESSEVLNAIKKLALRSRLSRVRIIILQPKTLVTEGHPLIDLSERLSSFIEIRKPGEQDKNYNHALLLVDDCGYIRRPHSDRFEAKANFCDRQTVSKLSNKFEKIWEHGLPDPNFRRLNL